MIFDFCTNNIKKIKSVKNASDSFKSKEYKKNILCVNTNCKWRAKSNKKRKNYWNNKKKLVWSRNEQKNLRADVANIRLNLTTTSSFTNIFAFGMRRSRNLFNNQLFHFLRHFNRWFFHFLFRHFNRSFCHFSRHRNFYFSRCLYQKSYANVQKAYHRNQ